MNLVEIGGSVLNMDSIATFLQSAPSLGYAYVGGFSYSFANDFDALEKENPDILKPKLYSNIKHSNYSDSENYLY